MAKNDKSVTMPRLRFPEFQHLPGWEKQPLSALLNYERPDEYFVSDTAYQQSGTPVLTANKSFILGYTNESDGIYEDLPAVIFDDFTTDKKYVNFPFKVKSSAIKILTTKGDDSLKLIFELMGGLNFKPKEHKRYYISEYQALEIALPKEAEQHKVIACLMSLDEVIAAQGRKVEALKAHKRGLMQQLFPRDGETVPRLRFSEFREGPEWAESALGSLAAVKNGYAFKSSTYATQGFRIVTIANVQAGQLALGVTKRIAELPTDLQNHQRLSVGDILISMTGNVGRVCLVNYPNLLLNQRVGKLIPYDVNQEFFYHALQRDEFRKTMQLKAAGGAQGNLSAPDIAGYVVAWPRNDKEQHRVADCLSSIDRQIAAESEKLHVMRNHKKGLMQQLFPPPEGT
ncbi:MAG: restriction endonuclease subunit S [Gemmatimonadota bacterium]